MTLSRYEGQGVYIDRDVYIKVISCSVGAAGDKMVRLAIEAPTDVAVTLSERGIEEHERSQAMLNNGTPARRDGQVGKNGTLKLWLGQWQGIYVDLDIYVKVVDITVEPGKSSVVKLSIEAPLEVAVTRSEMGILTHHRAQSLREKGRVPTREDLEL